MAEPRYAKSHSVNEVRDKTKRQYKARKQAQHKADVEKKYENINKNYEEKRRREARQEARKRNEKEAKARNFYDKVNADYKEKRSRDNKRKKAKAKNFYDKVNADYEKKQKANKSRDWERFKARQDEFKRKQMLKRDVKSFVKNTPGKVKRDILNSPTPSNRPDYQSMQSVRTGKERHGVKYIDKVKTKSGKIRYIYSKNNQGGGTRKSSPLDQAKRMASGAAKRLSKLSNRAKNAGSNFLKSIFK